MDNETLFLAEDIGGNGFKGNGFGGNGIGGNGILDFSGELILDNNEFEKLTSDFV